MPEKHLMTYTKSLVNTNLVNTNFTNTHYIFVVLTNLVKGAFIYDVRCFTGIFDLPTHPNQILHYISLFSIIR